MLCLIISEEVRCDQIWRSLYDIISWAQLSPTDISTLSTPHYMPGLMRTNSFTPTRSGPCFIRKGLATLFRACDEDLSQTRGSRVRVLTHCTGDTPSGHQHSPSLELQSPIPHWCWPYLPRCLTDVPILTHLNWKSPFFPSYICCFFVLPWKRRMLTYPQRNPNLIAFHFAVAQLLAVNAQLYPNYTQAPCSILFLVCVYTLPGWPSAPAWKA